MLIARAPVRVSFAGGGTDLPAYFMDYGGMVVSTTIDRYIYVILTMNSQESVQITSSDYRAFYRHPAGKPMPWDGHLALPQAVLHEFGIDRGMSIFLASEIPPGTGLGSSSAVAVALIKAVSTACGQHLGDAEVATMACRIEIEKLGAPIGWQDQFAVAHGGINAISFGPQGANVEPLRISGQTRRSLEQSLLLFFTHTSRKSSAILSHQRASSAEKVTPVIDSLHALKRAAGEVRQALEEGDIRAFGSILERSWQQKKQLAPGISNPRIDEAYSLAIDKGAWGGKITGAGGGGFLLICCPPYRQAAVIDALESLGLRRMDFRFETGGAKVITNALPRTQLRSFRMPALAGSEV